MGCTSLAVYIHVQFTQPSWLAMASSRSLYWRIGGYFCLFTEKEQRMAMAVPPSLLRKVVGSDGHCQLAPLVAGPRARRLLPALVWERRGWRWPRNALFLSRSGWMVMAELVGTSWDVSPWRCSFDVQLKQRSRRGPRETQNEGRSSAREAQEEP